ncbi:DAO-domain-containing protein [Ephemerocybe angulata]|uniref:Glycerol-3-phosphate dehydrogenase n=1 Tax=Ephemerocybe angulata TaxID=980116 RepID=A0A8H6HXV9_9AGAR|nr:DAO-domain-containing protein [Tulosesus angulatus]
MSVLRRVFSKKTLLYAAGGTALATGGGFYYLHSGPAFPASSMQTRRPPPPWTPPSRADMLRELKASGEASGQIRELKDGELAASGELKEGSIKTGLTAAEAEEEIFDLLIIGGGATGAGVAVDAASRGLKVALVERDDFSAGTSSKSTKLVHGGVRYLQKAVFELDYSQYKLVKEALHERKIFLETAPYLSHMLPIMLPIYKYWQVPYYWAGCKMYDVLAGKENMESSYVMSKGKALETFPMLKSEGLVGAVVYYDGQHNDSRMNIALILTAIKHGATVANYCTVTALHKSPSGRLTGAQVTDTLTNTSFPVRARGIINATGPFTDALLTLDNPLHKPICQASSGVHITLPGYYSPRTMGLLDPATSDGRVIFFLPWQGNTIAGTTDSPSAVVRDPEASEEDIRWVLDEVRSYLSPDIKVRRGDVLSAWSGLRPLVRNPDPSAPEGTAGLVRSHITTLSESGLLTIAGGKWTTYRKMAEECVDEAVRVFGLEGRARSGCVTEHVRLVGSEGWSRNMFIGLIQTYGLETEVARHLSDNYGDRAWTVLSLASPTNTTSQSWPLHGARLVPQYPFLDAEVLYAIRHEYAQTAIDVLARRTRLSFLNARAALDALPGVVRIMGGEMGWGVGERRGQVERAVEFLVRSMGLQGDAGEISKEVIAKMEREGKGGVCGGRASGWLSAAKGIFGGGGAVGGGGGKDAVRVYGRARFAPSEIVELRKAFAGAAAGRETVPLEEVVGVVKGLKGYGEATEGDWAYAIAEGGWNRMKEGGEGGRDGVDVEEFVEICGAVKEVGVRERTLGRERIPVGRSGGGV